jgi:hypothetical protein
VPPPKAEVQAEVSGRSNSIQMLQYRYLDNLDVHIQDMYSGTDYALDASGLHTYASTNYLDASVKGTNGRTDRCICKNRYLADICFLQTSGQGDLVFLLSLPSA